MNTYTFLVTIQDEGFYDASPDAGAGLTEAEVESAILAYASEECPPELAIPVVRSCTAKRVPNSEA